jgi:hypothetical protein
MLPRDAVEDVWERRNQGGIALERSQRVRRAPGWLKPQEYINPMQPYSLVGGPPGRRYSDEDAEDDGQHHSDPGNGWVGRVMDLDTVSRANWGVKENGGASLLVLDNISSLGCCPEKVKPLRGKGFGTWSCDREPGAKNTGLLVYQEGPRLTAEPFGIRPQYGTGALMHSVCCAAGGKRTSKKRSKDEYNNSYDSDRGGMDAGYRMAPYLPHADGNNARPRSGLCNMSGPGAEGGKVGGHDLRGGQGGVDPGSGLGPPVVVQWRLGPQGLEMTVVLNNRMFTGLLGACRNSSSSGGSWSAAANAAAGRVGTEAAGSAEPPHRGTRCTLCHKREEASVRDQEGMHGMSYKGLGPLMAAQMPGGGVLWIHKQCALWSPEVYMANGTLVS